MSINNPNKLVEEFKKSGEFDRIQRELLAEFQGSKDLASFKSRIEDVARQRLAGDRNLLYMPQEFIHREFMQELDRRLPIVERSTSELSMLNDPAFSARINSYLKKLLQDHGIPVNDQDKPHNIQHSNALSNGEEDEGSRPAILGEEIKQAQACQTNQDNPSSSCGGRISSVSKQEENTKNKDPDRMDVDKD